MISRQAYTSSFAVFFEKTNKKRESFTSKFTELIFFDMYFSSPATGKTCGSAEELFDATRNGNLFSYSASISIKRFVGLWLADSTRTDINYLK